MGTKLALTFACLTALSTTAAFAEECTPKHAFETLAKGKLTVALTNTPPYSLEKDSAISGIDGDLVKQFAKENCLEVTYEIFNYPGAVSAVQTERADVAIGGFYRTGARAKVTNLSTPVYLDQLAVASVEGLETVDQLVGKKVGTVEGYDWVLEMEDNFDGAGTYPSSLNLAQDVQAGRLDAGLEGYGAAVMLNKDTKVQVKLLQADPRINATMNPSQTSFLLSKTNEALVSAMNTTIEDLRAQGVVAKTLEAYGLHPSAAVVGEGRVIE